MTATDPVLPPVLSGVALERPRRLGWGLLATILLLLLSIGASGMLIIDNWTSGGDIIQAQKVQVVTFRVLALMQNAETGQRGYLLTGKKDYLDPYTRALQRLQPAVDELVSTAQGDPALTKQAADLDRLTKIKIAELQATLAAFDRAGPGAALPIVTTDQGKVAMDDIRATARTILERQSIILSDRTLRWRQNSDFLILTGVLALVLTVIAAALIIRSQRHHAAIIDAAREKLVAVNISLEQHVATRTADLKEANEEIQRYAHIASHDLRAPLVNIMGYSGELEIVRQEVTDLLTAEPAILPETRHELKRIDADFDEALSFIRQSIDKMNRLINAILTLARSGQREFRHDDLDMQALFASIKAMLQHQLTTKGAEFEIGSIPHIDADRLAVEQVFGNIAENAVKYLDPTRPGRITVTAQPAPMGVVFTIADNGRGIADKDLGRIFDPFRRAGQQDQPGEGIGLAHVRMLVRRLGGRITCQSELGVGSRFIVELPRHQGKARD